MTETWGESLAEIARMGAKKIAETFDTPVPTGRPLAWPNYSDDQTDDSEAESVSRCPACGDPIDYCQGHGAIGDPIGHSILSAHDDGYHGRCNPAGCEDSAEMIAAVVAQHLGL